MSISKRSSFLVVMAFAVTGLAVAHCGTDACLRFSDCAPGLTCGDGKCVPAAVPSEGDASLEASIDAAPIGVDAATFDAADAEIADTAPDADDSSDSGDSGDAGLLDAADGSG